MNKGFVKDFIICIKYICIKTESFRYLTSVKWLTDNIKIRLHTSWPRKRFKVKHPPRCKRVTFQSVNYRQFKYDKRISQILSSELKCWTLISLNISWSDRWLLKIYDEIANMSIIEKLLSKVTSPRSPTGDINVSKSNHK